MPLSKAVSMSVNDEDDSAPLSPLVGSYQIRRRPSKSKTLDPSVKLRHRYSVFDGNFDATQLRKQLSNDVSNRTEKAARRLSATISAAISASSSTAIAFCSHGKNDEKMD